MNAKTLAYVFGVVFLAIGVLGFVPALAPNGLLLGIFQIDTIHNIIHVLSGITALAMAKSMPKTYFKVFGIVYLIVTIVGFAQGTTVLGLIDVNVADNLLHLVLAIASLAIGFAM